MKTTPFQSSALRRLSLGMACLIAAGGSASAQPASGSRLVNLSILTSLSAPGDAFTMGYVVGGAGTSGTKPLVIRAAGPSLGALGVAGTLDDPKLELFTGATKTGENDNWGGSAALVNAMSAVGAFACTGPTSRDAAVALPVACGDNSVKVSAVGVGTGAVIAEIYDATPADSFSAATPRLVNVSVLKHLGTGLTVGFVVGGSGAKKLLVRAIGPSLGTAYGVSGALSDPQLTLYSGETAIAHNDNWGGTPALQAAFVSAAAFVLADASRDAATVVTLQPGNYTVVVSGVGNTTGIVLVEVYELPETPGPEPMVTPAGFSLIPAGTFTMGDSKNEGLPDERPTHSVTLSTFFLQQKEVSYEQWKEVVDWNYTGGHGYDFTPGQIGSTWLNGLSLANTAANITHPVTKVSWLDVIKWCNAKSRKEGLTPCYYLDEGFATELKSRTHSVVQCNWAANGYRLPTEAEWEYAARGGLAGETYPWGSSGITGGHANFEGSGDPFEGTTPVGYYNGSQTPAGGDMKNGYGLYDMVGNVCEWVWDWYGPYSPAAQTNPRGPASGTLRMYRGSGFRGPAINQRVAIRWEELSVNSFFSYNGFRPARSAVP